MAALSSASTAAKKLVGKCRYHLNVSDGSNSASMQGLLDLERDNGSAQPSLSTVPTLPNTVVTPLDKKAAFTTRFKTETRTNEKVLST